jgi:hypothetical protein
LGPAPTTSTAAATTKVAAFEPAFDIAGNAPPPAPPAPLFADVPDLNEPASSAASTLQPPNVPDDFFGTPLSPPPMAPPGASAGSYRASSSKEELFDMATAAPPSVSVAENFTATTVRIASAPAPTSAPKPVAAAPDAGGRRNALALVVNVGIAVVLVAALIIVGSALLNEGTLDASTFSAARLKALVSPNSDFEATDISNGLYDTVRGKPVFFVRGEVMNRGTSASRIRVRAEILDGEIMVRAAEVVAGTPPTPEQLRNLGGADEVERLLIAVSKTAPSIGPGESASFLVTFFEYPPDLKAFRVRVSARAEGGETANR